MAMSWLKWCFAGAAGQVGRKQRRDRARAAVEPLCSRVMMSITALFSEEAGLLRVTGDELDNVITISRDAGGNILVNGGAVPIAGGTPTVGNTSHLHIVGAGGNDNISLNQANGILPGAALFGGDGVDTIVGGSNEDFADGGTGADSILLGAGDDTFQWNPGDASDVVDGQAGRDEMLFNGADVSEEIHIFANGNRTRFTRSAGNINMDLGGIEAIDFNAFGGSDVITVNDLSSADLVQLNLNLSSAAGAGDGAVDTVIINGTDAADGLQIASFDAGARVAIAGLFPFINITGGERERDLLTVNMLGGDDIVDAGSLSANALWLVLSGGAGDDELLAGGGDDLVNGGAGEDHIFLEAGDDTFIWRSGDGSDTVEGMGGRDTMIFNGEDIAESVAISGSAGRVRFTRDIGGVSVDLGGVEQIDFNALGGADSVVVNNLNDADLTEINLNLSGATGGTTADGQVDSVVVNGSNESEIIPVVGTAGGVLVNGDFLNLEGLPYFMILKAVDPTDVLRINGNGGSDTIEPGLDTPILLSADGGEGHDKINVLSTAANGIVRVLPSGGDDSIDVNTDDFGVANVVFGETQRIGELRIGSGGSATVSPGGQNVLTLTSVATAGDGKLDLADNDMIVDYTGGSPIESIRSMLLAGRNGGAWNGGGIVTSLGNASTFALGFGEASSLFPGGRFSGGTVDASAVVVKFTFYGDANLDGQVNIADLGLLASNWQLAARSWSDGDFDYSSTVEVSDLGLLATNWQAGVGSSQPPALRLLGKSGRHAESR